MSILRSFFATVNSPMKEFQEKGIPKILKESSKTGNCLTANSAFQKNEKGVSFQSRDKQLQGNKTMKYRDFTSS